MTIEPDGTWKPTDTISMTYGEFLDAIKDAARAALESERISIAERVDKLHHSAIEIGASPLVIDGIKQALDAIAGGIQE